MFNNKDENRNSRTGRFPASFAFFSGNQRRRTNINSRVMRDNCPTRDVTQWDPLKINRWAVKLHNRLKSTQGWCCVYKTSSVPPRKSSATFGYLGQTSENVWRRSSSLRNNFGKSSEIFGKWSLIFGKLSKTSLLVCLSHSFAPLIRWDIQLNTRR